MSTRDPRIDAYIEKSADFAKPILTYIREVVHTASPDIEETMKWSAPHFMYKGMLCGVASFKQHCAFGFWKGSLVLDDGGSSEGMGQFGRITRISDLPPKSVLVGHVRKAMDLNELGIPARRTKPKRKADFAVPNYFTAALRKNKKALATFEAFSPSHRREYVEWITDAEGEETRQRRLKTAIEWMAEGKPRNWKYMGTRGP